MTKAINMEIGESESKRRQKNNYIKVKMTKIININ